MISSQLFEIKKYNFNSEITEEISSLHFANDLWPIVYILSHGNEKIAYVGETTDAVARMSAHLKNNKKIKLSEAHLIESELFNKSATLDIESNLIQYVSGDGQYQLLNGNVGLANHNYYQKDDVYWNMFTSIWDNLRTLGIAKHSIEHINNSDLFKYSPYKSLSSEQLKGLTTIIDNLLNDSYHSIIMQGGAGTGKTILAIFLFKLLVTDLSDFNFKDLGSENGNDLIDKINKLRLKFPNPRMALVVPMSSFRNTLKKVFSKVKGLKASMVIGPAEVANREYDILVVDEAHRLRRRVNLGAYYGAFDKANHKLDLTKESGTELDWMIKQAKCAIYFYDENQSIKPSDVRSGDFQKLMDKSDTKVEKLTSQFRVRGGNGYVKFVHNLLNVSLPDEAHYSSDKYEVKVVDSMQEMIETIKTKENEVGLSRMIAGYSWEWVSKNKEELFDIDIEGIKLKWNTTNSDWINSPNAINEVGCIHTTQGYDLNYAGIIFGHEIGFDKEKKEIIIHEENYFDRNGKQSIKDSEELKSFILNIYKTILLRGIRGTYIYVCDPDLRDYIAKYLSKDEFKETPEEVTHIDLVPFENAVPLFDLQAAAGFFSDKQIIDDFSNWVAIPSDIRASEDLFACRVVGESMNRVIPNGSICLFRKYNGGSRSGKIVLVQSSEIQDTEMGSSYTVKEYYSKKVMNDSGWEHQTIILKPLSNDESYQDIVLEADGMDTFQVIGVFERVLN